MNNKPWGSSAALAGVAVFLATVVVLHFLQPGYDPAGQLMSELALGHSILPMGVGQRLAAACLLAWLMVLSWRLRR